MPRIEAVLLAAIFNMLVGAFWYSQRAYGRQWQELVDKKAREIHAHSSKAYRASFIAALASAYVMAKLMMLIDAKTIWDGIGLGLLLWLGCVLAAFIPAYLYAKRPTKLLFIDTGYLLLAFMGMGIIISLFM